MGNKKELTITNDTPTIEDVENNIENNVTGGDALINDYIDDVDQIEWDFADNANNLKFMGKYLRNAINVTQKGGPEYEDHKELANMITQLSGKWRASTYMYDMGD